MPSETSSDARLTSLFLDMLAAEQGAGVNTLDAYRGDLEDLSGFLARKKSSFQTTDTQMLRDYLDDLDTRGFKSSSVARKTVIHAPSVPLSSERACPRTICGDPVRPEAGTGAAESAVHRRCRRL